MKKLLLALLLIPSFAYAQRYGPSATALQGIPISTTFPTTGQSLVFSSVTGQWTPTTVSSGGSPGGTTGAVQFNTSGSFAGDASHLFWDSSNHWLGINTGSPRKALEVIKNAPDAVLILSGQTSGDGGVSFQPSSSGVNIQGTNGSLSGTLPISLNASGGNTSFGGNAVPQTDIALTSGDATHNWNVVYTKNVIYGNGGWATNSGQFFNTIDGGLTLNSNTRVLNNSSNTVVFNWSALTLGSSGQALTTDGASNVSWASVLLANHPTTVGTTPAVSSCGSGATIAGNDSAGRVTTGTSTGSTCTVTFAASWPTAPVCFINDESAILSTNAAPTMTNFVISATGALGDTKVFDYHCIGY